MSQETSDAVILHESNTVSIPRDNSKMAAAMVYGGDASTYYLSVPFDDPQRDEILTKCAFAPDYQVKDKVGQVIELKHIYGTRVSLANPQTGELDEAIHTCLIDTKGEVYACTSKGMAKSVQLLLQSKGSPDEWKAPIKVLVISIKAKVGMMLALKVLPSTEPPKGKK